MWLAVYMARKFMGTGETLEDLVSVACVGLVKAMNHYDPNRNVKPPTYARKCIENELMMYCRRNVKKVREISLNQMVFTDGKGSPVEWGELFGTDQEAVAREVMGKEAAAELCMAVATLRGREKQIIQMRFGLNGETEKTQKQVALELGITQPYVSKIERRALARIKAMIE